MKMDHRLTFAILMMCYVIKYINSTTYVSFETLFCELLCIVRFFPAEFDL